MNPELNRLLDTLATLRKGQIEATERGDHDTIRRIDQLVNVTLDEVELARDGGEPAMPAGEFARAIALIYGYRQRDAAADDLGLSYRQVTRYCNDEAPVPARIARKVRNKVLDLGRGRAA